MSLLPGKGAHIVLNEQILAFITEALEDVKKCYSDELHDDEPITVLDQLMDPTVANRADEWYKVKDNFGTKVFAKMPYKKGELRLTVVHTKQGDLKLDLREWYEPSES